MRTCIIVIPCYNEAGRLDPKKFLEFLRDRCYLKFVFVNDGSLDATGEILDAVALSGQVRVLHLGRNCGKAEAIRLGVLIALGESPASVGYWDADLATPLEVIDEFRDILDERTNVQVVVGARVKLLGRAIDRSPLRRFLGRMFATLSSLVVGLPLYDTQCGAKMFRVCSWTADLFETSFLSRWIFDVELLCRLRIQMERNGIDPLFSVYEYPLHEWRDVEGTKLRARDFVRAGWELLSITLRRRVVNTGLRHT